jgi:asparagine synthase (glutamine-hydrolysing)
MQLRLNGVDYTIVYNGELYNTEELRLLLLQLGHKFVGHSDTEVVLHAYAQWQERCLDRLNGIFAFAVYETKRNKLFLARDRMGVKPLFYKEHNGGFIFASELKTILAYPTVKAAIDRDGIAQIVLLGPGRCPGSGVFNGIKELEPGCYGYYAAGKWNWKRYWKLLDREHSDSFEDTAKQVAYLVTDSIKRQMVSDVPIGTF